MNKLVFLFFIGGIHKNTIDDMAKSNSRLVPYKLTTLFYRHIFLSLVCKTRIETLIQVYHKLYVPSFITGKNMSNRCTESKKFNLKTYRKLHFGFKFAFSGEIIKRKSERKKFEFFNIDPELNCSDDLEICIHKNQVMNSWLEISQPYVDPKILPG